MKFIQGNDRDQTHLFPTSLNDSIDSNNEIRLIDLFVDSLSLEKFGFKIDYLENGRPAYHPSDLLKLYMYGYLNSVRSSRKLEKSCKINIELMWLLKTLTPDHNTISNFRRDNPQAIKKVFRSTVKMAQKFNLIGGKLIAGDSTKLRAQNSKKNNFNTKKIERHLAYIDAKLEEHNRELAKADGDANGQIADKINQQEKRKETYKQLSQQLEESGEKQISTSDPESRQMITRNNITEVAYNVQTSVDEKHKIPIDYKVTNTNDSKAMGNMLSRAKTILRSNKFTALYDKGYHTGSEFAKADALKTKVMVAIPGVAGQAPNPSYNVEHFIYQKQDDYYTCPEGNKLTTPGTWHTTRTYKFKRYTTKDCMQCPVKEQCSKAKYGKGIQRSEYSELIEQNKLRIEDNKQYYRQRQSIVEHPYGTIKRQWGFSYILTKKYKHRAEADVGLMFIAYNFRRILNIVGKKELRMLLSTLARLVSYVIDSIRVKISHFSNLSYFNKSIANYYNPWVNQLKLA